MLAKHALVGFDVRVWGPEQVPDWLDERRNTFLLRADAAQPLSTDNMVWPQPAGLDLDRATSRHPTLPLLTDLAAAQKLLGVWPGVLVAVTVNLNSVPVSDQQGWQGWQAYLPPAMLQPAAEWTLLGLDVSDPWLLSGLSNCGYEPAEHDVLASRFGPHLNKHHLFTDMAQARAFQVLTDERVPEHEPFAVFGLYLIGPGQR